MAIVSINEHWTGRGASEEAKDGKADFERSYIVVVDSAEDGPQTILADSRIPQMYAVYTTNTETNLKCRVVDRRCDQEGEGYFIWMVTVTYSSQWYDQAKNDPNPLLRPEISTWSTEDYQEVFEKDLDNLPVVTRTNEPFDPPVMRQASRLTLTVEKNVPFVDPPTIEAFLFAVNSEYFRGFPPGQAMLTAATWTETYEGELAYDKLRLTFRFNRNGWERISILHQGYMARKPAAPTKIRRVLDDTGAPSQRPVLLDASGFVLDLSVAGTEPVFLRFRAYPRKNFADLGIQT